MDILIGLAIFAVIAGIYFGRKEMQKRWRDYEVPEPAQKRGDILFGYYGSYMDTASAKHTNLFWAVPHWEGLEKTIEDIRKAMKVTVLDLQEALFEKLPGAKKYTPIPPGEQEARLRALFGRLRDERLLSLVTILYPVDEPNLPETDVDEYMPTTIALVRHVASQFDELRGAKIGVSFYYDRPMQHIQLYDIVGYNKYHDKSGTLRPGELYDQMSKQMRPGQRTWLFPGGTYGEDPTQHINFAHSHPEVIAIIPFIYRVPPWETSFRGIADIPEMKDKYEAAGRGLGIQ